MANEEKPFNVNGSLWEAGKNKTLQDLLQTIYLLVQAKTDHAFIQKLIEVVSARRGFNYKE
jgi:hypothetical protein